MLMKGLVTNLILAESIKTTLPKAKEARKYADKIVTIAKKGDLAARRLASSRLLDPEAVKKLFDKIAPAMKDRKGGYTRIVKLGTRRGDSAEMCVLQYLTAAEPAEAAEGAKEPEKEVK
jgi:large subunit ribosomal protein L17